MGRIQRKVYGVAELYDRFAQKPLNTGLRVHTFPPQKTVIKEDGSVVFLENEFDREQKDGFLAQFESAFFQKKTIFIKRETDSAYYHCCVWMEPDSDYRYPGETTYLTGNAKEKAFIVVPKVPMGQNIRMTMDYPGGSSRMGLHGLPMKVEGRQYIFYQDSDKPVSEVFTLKAKEAGECFLEKPLENSYRRKDVTVYPVYPVTQKEDGTFFLALNGIKEKEFYCDFLFADNEIVTYKITAGKWNNL